MPVKAVGKKIVEVATGKVKGVATSAKNAQTSARIRNKAIEGKKQSKKTRSSKKVSKK